MDRETTIFETSRLAMRPWRDGDAEVLYGHARNPAVGPIAGWPVHTSVEESREIIAGILSVRGTWAITVKPAPPTSGSDHYGGANAGVGMTAGAASNLTSPTGGEPGVYETSRSEPGVGEANGRWANGSEPNGDGAIVSEPGADEPIGSIGLMVGTASNLTLPPTEGEIGYWIAEPFWGRGYTTEAARELVRRAFTELGLRTLWCGWFEGNDRSRRVGEKCGFRHVRTEERYWPAIGRTMTQHISRLTKGEWNDMTRRP